MRTAPSPTFRRQCLALALLAATWAVPGRASADFYPLQELANITGTLKPNVLIVLESAESMQGLPGENVARYNAVGADCEEGNASCRLMGQRGRWGYSGMGSKGIYFGTAASTCTNTFTDTVSDTETFANTQTWLNPSATLTGTSTVTKPATVTNTSTITKSNTLTSSNTITSSNTVTNTATAYGTNTYTANGTGTGTFLGTTTFQQTVNVTFTGVATVTSTALTYSPQWTVSDSSITTGTVLSQAWNNNCSMVLTKTVTSPISTETSTVTATAIVTGTMASTLTLTATRTTGWGASPTWYCQGPNASATQTSVAPLSNYGSGVVTWHNTITGSGTLTKSDTITTSTTALGTSTFTAYGTNTSTSYGSVTSTSSQTSTATGSTTALGSDTFTQTGTRVDTQSYSDTSTFTATGTKTDGTCAFPGAPDPGDCVANGSDSTNRGFCNYATYASTATSTNTATLPTSYVPCSSELICNAYVKGDFCRYISELDYSGRAHAEQCIGNGTNTVTSTATSTDWGTCKRGLSNQNMACGYSTGTCPNALYGDFCAEGKPAKMCAESGIWCSSDSDCLAYRCSGSGDLCTEAADCPVAEACIYQALAEQCVPASSRMMIVKRALRRAISDFSDDVNFGFMTTYQGRGIPSTATDASTAVFPYVRVTNGATATETKLLTRGELELAGCFTVAGGPASSCTIDYGGNGALNADATLNKVTYTRISGSDSLWNVPRVDVSGKSKQIVASWSSCSSSGILPLCKFSGQGTGVYEGSYYTFQYTRGTPVPSGSGSMAQPVYYETYKGKSPTIGGVLYNAIDAERADFINDGIYGRPAYVPTNLALATPYTMVNRSIVTSTGTSTGVTTVSVLAPDPARESTVPPPWSGATAAVSCGTTTGALWNYKVVPPLNATTFGGPGITAKAITRAQRALMTTARLEKASFGGITATGEPSPIACSLKNDALPDSYHGAAGYLTAMQGSDAANNGNQTTCWSNNIVLVVDGKSDGPGDIGPAADCASVACAYDANSNPNLTGCQCGAITKAYALAHPTAGVAPIQTHVVVAVPGNRWSVRYPYTYAFLWNLAVVGSPKFDGTPSFGATEDEVYKAISQKVALAAHSIPSYTTTAPVPGANVQDPNTLIVTSSTYLYDTASSYPSWKGTVRAYDASSGVQLLWDAATVAANGHPSSWTGRRVFFGNGSGVSRVTITAGGSISNKSDLYGAGLGATADEAEKIMQWLLGKPGSGNRSPLMGPVSASTPIVVGQSPDNGLVGAKAYSAATWTRPPLVYVGSDDGVLHAFFAHSGSKTLGGTSYQGGEEAFAFIPKDMLPAITKLYAQGGQPMSANKGDHIFGLAGSPKVKDMCIGTSCQTDTTGAGWHTVLVMTEGPGGNKPFALDITRVVDANLGLLPSNPVLLWSADQVSDSATWNADLGETLSVPGFYFAGYSSVGGPNRVIFASGYPTTAPATQGLYIVDANAATGAIVQAQKVTLATPSPTSCSSPYTQTHVVLADVAVARDYSSLANSQSLKGAYTGDTWGNVYQYVPSAANLTTVAKLGCGQPIHFSPAVVQLDRLPKADPTSKDKIYLAQVTNSNLDPVTQVVSATYPGSKLMVTRINASTSSPAVDTTFNSGGSITLSVCPSTSTSADCICIQNVSGSVVSDFDGSAKLFTQGCAAAGGANLPESARPVGTPTAVLRSDGLGFQVITSWYDAGAITNVCAGGDPSGFNYGKSYITVHEFRSDGSYYQLKGLTLNNAVLTGGTFVGTSFIVDGIGVSSDQIPKSVTLGQTFSTTQQVLSASALGRFARTTWTERVE